MLWPGSPWRPERPRSWRSMRRDSCRSVPMICRPASGCVRSSCLSSLMSVPRPAMLVAIVIAAFWPAPATISASRWWYFAFSTSCLSPRRLSWRDSVSEISTLTVPMRIGQPEPVQPLDLVDDRVVLLLPGLVDPVGLVGAADRPVGRDDADLEPVDRVELGLLGLGGAGHAGQLVVHPEVVLDRDRGEGLGLALDLHLLLGLDRLVQPVGPAPPGHDAAGELVDDQHLALLHQVVHVLLVQDVGLQQLVDDVQLLALERVVAPRPCGAARSGRAARGPDPCRSGGSPRRCPAPGSSSGSSGDIASAPRSVRWTEWPFSSSTK